MPAPPTLQDQAKRYDEFWGPRRKLRAAMRFDVRYRCRRMGEVLDSLGISRSGAEVLDVGFGSGAMLLTFPSSCSVVGADVGRSAVEAAKENDEFARFASAEFELVEEDDLDGIPEGPFDLIISSHTLEHMLDDKAALEALRSRLKDGGHLVLFVPIEEPDYITFHLRNYSMQSLQLVVRHAGLEILHVEPSMFINGHVWKLLTIPSRRHWPVVRHLVDAFRLGSLSSLPYPVIRQLDSTLHRLGFGPRQGLVIARK